MSVKLLAPRHAAHRLACSVSRLTQFDREGLLVAIRDSANRRLYDPAAVERFRQERELAKKSRRAPGTFPSW